VAFRDGGGDVGLHVDGEGLGVGMRGALGLGVGDHCR